MLLTIPAVKRNINPLIPYTEEDVEITSEEDDLDAEDPIDPEDNGEGEADSDQDETAEQKRLRLATKYLEDVRRRQEDEEADEEQKHSLIKHR